FAMLSRGGRLYLYKNKRSAERDPRKISINMEEFCKTLYSFRFGPPDVYGGTAHLFDTGKDGGYTRLFGADGEISTTIGDEHFEWLAGTWFLCEKVREVLKVEKERLVNAARDSEEAAMVKQALERRWLIYFTVGEAVRRRYEAAKLDVEPDLRRLAKPKWLDSPVGVAQEVRRYTRFACEILVKVYRSAAKTPSFVPRNWFRSNTTLADITTEIQYSGIAIETLNLLRGA
ncbi:MAG TPA: hypothetical protein VJX67_09565, partial [Blastocatellia bacterium]|nr:hypothetical protein [Blastocatellia bacterium]